MTSPRSRFALPVSAPTKEDPSTVDRPLVYGSSLGFSTGGHCQRGFALGNGLET
jgi:hypothetical protein